jgi:tRNA A-37 threonylcarbamoyl transferase component Bud32
MPREDEKIGTVIAGKYRIDGFVQKGGMGAVFSATHLDLGRKVAVKMFHRHLTDDSSLVVRFLNEAKGTSRINHRNVVDILDVGMDDEGLPFFVMEYLEGETLKERLTRKGRLSLVETADLVIPVLQGLQAAHLMGIVHRDLKPGNIFIAREADGAETVKILDFGIARFMELEMEGRGLRTATGSLLGTPEYMSLEQARGIRELIDHRTDIYSCGVILYVCLTGKSPLRGATQMDTIQNIAVREVPPPSSEDPDLPAHVDAVIMKAMDRDREKRFQDCASFLGAMEAFYALATTLPARRSPRFVQAGAGAVMPVTLPTSDVSVPDTTMDAAEAAGRPALDTLTPTPSGAVLSPGEAGRPKGRRYLILLLVLIIAAVALLLGGGYLVLQLVRSDETGARPRGAQTAGETPVDRDAAQQEEPEPETAAGPAQTAAAAGTDGSAKKGVSKTETSGKKTGDQDKEKPAKDKGKKDKSKKKKGKGHGKSR